MVEKIKVPFSLNPDEYAADSLPSLDEWKALWGLWDTVTRGMLPQKALLSKPIDLRNACIFYLGHIPTFCDLQLTKTMAVDAKSWGSLAKATEPSSYSRIFERGIDPDVDNPDHCHSHSETPDEWPALDDILEYQGKVRARIQAIYKNGEQKGHGVEEGIGRNVARGVWVAFEHEAMHLETLLFMMLQSDDTLPPPGIEEPDWETMARDARRRRVENQWHRVPEQVVDVGMDDPEESNKTGGHFGWDIEKPSRKVKVPAFEIKGSPITNEEYAKYMVENNMATRPESWALLKPSRTNGHSNGHSHDPTPVSVDGAALRNFIQTTGVRTVFGLVPLKHALDWPVFASYDEITGCAAWMGGRIPTADEVRGAYAHADRLRLDADARAGKLERMVPAVNGHLLHDGVEVTPPPPQSQRAFAHLAGSSPRPGANVGFTHWHPVAVTGDGDRLGGRGEMGGVWEWTSSVLERHEGFEPMVLYPGFTADFFDGKHNIILGGSWATIPRIAGRKSFVNWFQRNYRYVWAGARLARDI
jgi:formylglycine-generating enzyme required for sulfatase activity